MDQPVYQRMCHYIDFVWQDPKLFGLCYWLSHYYMNECWHELGRTLTAFVSDDEVKEAVDLIQLYDSFIIHFETKINLLTLAQIVGVVCLQYENLDDAITYLEAVIERIQATQERRKEEPILCIKAYIAMFNIRIGNNRECKSILENAKSTLDSMTDVDPIVYASYHWASLLYYQFCENQPAEFYKTAFLCLSFMPVESIPDPIKLFLAENVSVAALLGDNIYNFGELLAHPIIESLKGSEKEWLHHLLKAFNSGNLDNYQQQCRLHRDSINAHPLLAANEEKLREKMNIFCIMEIIFRQPLEDRSIPLNVIAERTRLIVEEVEHLLMKCLSAHLIEGVIDQVDGIVHVSWVQPRVLEIPQIQALRYRLDNWIGKVHWTTLTMLVAPPDLAED